MIAQLQPTPTPPWTGPDSNDLPARFTIDGGVKLENELHRLCGLCLERVQQIAGERLEAMLLGGGYGRGEGGVLQTENGESAYNDLEFYVFLKGPLLINERRFQPLLHRCAEEITREAEIDVEFHALSFSKLRRSEPNMFYYDLVMGHRWILGVERMLNGCEHHRNAPLIPLSEASRLLMNRCSGLLFAKERLQRPTFSAEDADFVARNIAKAKLALGDVVLTVLGEYHWSCRERNRRLAATELNTPWFAALKTLHSEGVAFKLHPERQPLPREALSPTHDYVCDLGRQVWLWLESKRLEKTFATPRDYCISETDKCPETSRLKNLAINLRAFSLSGLRRQPVRYPRHRVLNSLPLLLWEWDSTANLNVTKFVQRELAASADSFPALVAAYRNLWQRFN